MSSIVLMACWLLIGRRSEFWDHKCVLGGSWRPTLVGAEVGFGAVEVGRGWGWDGMGWVELS